jgi:hypothetical protein
MFSEAPQISPECERVTKFLYAMKLVLSKDLGTTVR